MSARKEIYFVFPMENLWMVSCESELEAWGPYPSRAEALRMARAVAEVNPPSEVLLWEADGLWQIQHQCEGGP
jgi:hypothetical protein